jgi:hypothetical protein
MEYLNEHGSFVDAPYDLLLAKYAHYYPTLVKSDNEYYSGDLHVEIENDVQQ